MFVVVFDAVLPAGEARMLVDTSVVIYMPLEPVFALRRGRWMLYADWKYFIVAASSSLSTLGHPSFPRWETQGTAQQENGFCEHWTSDVNNNWRRRRITKSIRRFGSIHVLDSGLVWTLVMKQQEHMRAGTYSRNSFWHREAVYDGRCVSRAKLIHDEYLVSYCR